MPEKKIGRYIVQGTLGEGAMGCVYKAHDPNLERTVAIKTMRTNNIGKSESYEEFKKRFFLESRANGKLNHPNIVGIYDSGIMEKDPYLVMEYIEGIPLDAFIESQGDNYLHYYIDLMKQIAAADFSVGAAEMLNEILRTLTHSIPAGSFEAHRAVIDSCFGFDTAEEIVAALEADGSEWALAQLKTLRAKSPETVKVALRQLREGGRLSSFRENMQMEYRIGWRKVQSHDFQEGVRAVIIDKDNAPAWSPARIEDVPDEMVAKYFEPLGTDELTF